MITISRFRWAVAGLALALAFPAVAAGSTAGAAPITPAFAGSQRARPHVARQCTGAYCYFFSTMWASGATTSGMSARLSQARPKIRGNERYTGATLQVTSSDNEQAIQFGWWVSTSIFGDSLPHLVMSAFIDGAPQCLNACGFVQVAKGPRAGSRVKVGTLGAYTIKRAPNRWLLVYNRKVVGYFPTSLWKGKLNKSSYEAAFGVVASTSQTNPRSQMGNGQLGTAPRSAKVVAMKLIGAVGTPTFTYFSLDAPNTYKVGHYDVGCVAACSMNYGGPGT
jgi:Neprosin